MIKELWVKILKNESPDFPDTNIQFMFDAEWENVARITRFVQVESKGYTLHQRFRAQLGNIFLDQISCLHSHHISSIMKIKEIWASDINTSTSTFLQHKWT